MSNRFTLTALISAAIPAAAADRIAPADAARIAYSTQRFVCLDVGESYAFKLKSGAERRLRLISVTERTDSVIDLLRRADIAVEIDGARLDLVCEPYRMPVERSGIRVQADTTTGWTDLPKRVQFSLWDASDPIVDTTRFAFPLPGYRLFSQGTQGYNEPVHLGHRDGDPEGQRFHHNYGFDLAGFEGKEQVASCIAGTIAYADRDDGTLGIEDDRGIVFMYGHLHTILPPIEVGAKIAIGTPVGLVGRRGGSGNFSHLHVGLFLSMEDLRADRPCRALNLYPWLVEAYRAKSGMQLAAVARPHLAVRVGEVVAFDGTRSLLFDAPGGSRDAAARGPASYRWEFSGGISSLGPRAERAFDAPGTYAAALWVEDGRGERDVDFATVRVYSREKPEPVMPTLFLTYTPSGTVRAGDAVSFRLWPQGRDVESIRIDFGDGRVVERYEPFSTIEHRFTTAGLHIVTATGSAGGLPITQKAKVIVEPTP